MYLALAILVGVAYGLHGLEILSFFYFWSGAWVVFFGVWGRAARAAGRWNVDRAETVPVRPERDDSRPAAGEPEPAAQRELAVQRDPLAAL